MLRTTTTCSGWLWSASPVLWPGLFSSHLTVWFDPRWVLHLFLQHGANAKLNVTSAAGTSPRLCRYLRTR